MTLLGSKTSQNFSLYIFTRCFTYAHTEWNKVVLLVKKNAFTLGWGQTQICF